MEKAEARHLRLLLSNKVALESQQNLFIVVQILFA
jgi:hypothetical protein